jgi:hypothetical protein
MAASFSRLPQLLNSVYPAIPAENYLALSVLLYVITFEGWIWAMRIWAKVRNVSTGLRQLGYEISVAR